MNSMSFYPLEFKHSLNKGSICVIHRAGFRCVGALGTSHDPSQWGPKIDENTYKSETKVTIFR